MLIPVDITTEVVEDLRSRRSLGAKASDLVRLLQERGYATPQISRYIEEAFCLSGNANLSYRKRDQKGFYMPEFVNAALEPMLEESRERWSQAGAYPDLLQQSHRQMFREVAHKFDCILIVAAVNPHSRQYSGRSGFAVCPFWVLGIVRSHPPYQGLLCADPEDERFIAKLGVRSYEQYAKQLLSSGFSIANRTDGYIIRDNLGRALFPAYSLQGVYEAGSGKNAWTGRHGELIRYSLNSRTGEELVQTGPLDSAEMGADAPRLVHLPLLFFLPDTNVLVYTDLAAVQSYYRYLKIPWKENTLVYSEL